MSNPNTQRTAREQYEMDSNRQGIAQLQLSDGEEAMWVPRG